LSIALLLPFVACGRGERAKDPAPPPTSSEAPAGTPVTVAKVETATLAEVVHAPGQTAALVEQQMRAPFAGTIGSLDVVEGDRVASGQAIGEIVSRESAAALDGALSMETSARTDAERADAARAVELARAHVVRAPLVASAGGIVVRRSATKGDRVAEDQELIAIADARSFVFRAQLAQSDLARIRPGQAAVVELAGGRGEIAGTVHGLLPGADAGDLTAPVRIDLVEPPPFSTAGLFGTARITIERRADVPVVPAAAVMRDDVSGVVRLGLVSESETLHWVEGTTGLAAGGRVEIVTPKLEVGQAVVTTGQVGLEEGTPLTVER